METSPPRTFHVALVAGGRRPTGDLMPLLERRWELRDSLLQGLLAHPGVGLVTFLDLVFERELAGEGREEAIKALAGHLLRRASSPRIRIMIRGLLAGHAGLPAAAPPQAPGDAQRLVTWLAGHAGTDDVVRAAGALASSAGPPTVEAFESHLDLAGLSDPDLVILAGTGGLLPDALLYQLSYGELFLLDKDWERVTVEDLESALASFAGRQRRYGKL